MLKIKSLISINIIFILTSLTLNVKAQLELSKLFNDHMVIQRNQPINVWGWYDRNAEIQIQFNTKSYSAIADEKGQWRIVIPEMEAGGPYKMKISAMDESITLNDILIGDVWVCSGQSNMEWIVAESNNAEEEISSANDKNIRHFKVPLTYSKKPEEKLAGGEWKVTDPSTAGEFTAVGYFFARELRKKVEIPIGLINTSWGGSRIEPWMSAEVLNMEDPMQSMEEYQREREEEFKESLNGFMKYFPEISVIDDIVKDEIKDWYNPDIDVSTWQNINVPGIWEEAGYDDLDGIAWYRTSFKLTDLEAQENIELVLGKIDDSDLTWINGVKVGGMEQSWNKLRNYEVESSVLKEGENILVIRVEDTGGGGGIWGDDNTLVVKTSTEEISLLKNWKFKIESVMKPGLYPNQVPTILYNKMIYPILGYPIKGALWYQGESNTSNFQDAFEYRELFAKMITDWRAQWNIGDFPFLFVQLANFMEVVEEPSESAWAILRESQSEALKLENTAQAVIIDIGEADDIHPLNKQDVGLRLSLAARKYAYNKSLVFSGPIYKDHEIKDNKIIVSFDHVGTGLTIGGDDEFIQELSIAGEDGKFQWAKAIIEGDKVIVWNENIEHPKNVRYTWADNPAKANLYNKEGLPASPFRTDNFTMIDIE